MMGKLNCQAIWANIEKNDCILINDYFFRITEKNLYPKHHKNIQHLTTMNFFCQAYHKYLFLLHYKKSSLHKDGQFRENCYLHTKMHCSVVLFM